MFTIDVRPWTDDDEEAGTASGVEKWLQRPESTPIGCSVDRIDESPARRYDQLAEFHGRMTCCR